MRTGLRPPREGVALLDGELQGTDRRVVVAQSKVPPPLANEDVVPAGQLREAYSRIRDLERLLGRKQMEIEILQAAQEVVKKSPWLRKGSGR